MIHTSPLPAAAAPGAAAEVSSPATEATATVAAKAKRAGKTSASSPAAKSTAAETARELLRDGVVAGLVRAIGAGRTSSTARRSPVGGYATAASTAKTASLAFLRDPKLSLEEKLLRLIGYLNAKWDQQIQAKLDGIAAREGTAQTAASKTKTKSKGLLGGLASAFSSALGGLGGVVDLLKISGVKTALKKLGGPILAAAASALGFPAAAPILLQYGPTVVDAAMGIATAAASGSSKASQSAGASGAASSDSQQQTAMLEIQHIRDKQKEMFGLVSNILRANHDTRSAIINNMR